LIITYNSTSTISNYTFTTRADTSFITAGGDYFNYYFNENERDQSMRIVIIGLGGIGSWLAEPLIRYAYKKYNDTLEVLLIDGDSYSNSNLERQSIHPKLMGMNKASAIALKLRQYFPEVDIKEYPEYLNLKNIDILRSEHTSYVFNCCDNNFCRKIVSEYMDKKYMNNYFLFSGGNELYDGNSHIQQRNRYNGKSELLTVTHPEVGEASENEDRGAMSCGQIAELPASGQIIFTNFWCAAIMLQQFYTICCSDYSIKETFFDIKKSALNAIRTN